jgi:hypothetical protein
MMKMRVVWISSVALNHQMQAYGPFSGELD